MKFVSLIAGVLLWTAASLANAATSYPLTCRGGGTIGLVAQTKKAVMYFGKSGQLAGAGLQPGQCAFADRGVSAAEPPCLDQANVNAVAWITGGNVPSATAATSTHFQPNDTRTQWMRKLLSNTNYQTFYVFNPGNGACFTVTSP